MNLLDIFKRFIFTGTYIRLFPLSDKDEAVKKINTLDFNENSQFSEDIQTLVKYIFSNIDKDNIDKSMYERSLKGCYKTKRVKVRDDETDKKTVENVRIKRRGVFNENDINRFNDKIDELDDNSNALSQLAERILDGKITQSDLQLCDTILKQNKFSWRFYVAIIAIVIIAITVIFLI